MRTFAVMLAARGAMGRFGACRGAQPRAADSDCFRSCGGPLAGLLAALSIGLLVGFAAPHAAASDHDDAPVSTADPAADLGDLYAWHTPDRLTIALTFAGMQEAGGEGAWDRDLLYGIHIDRDADGVADIDIWIRFGQDVFGQWGVQVSGLPGSGPEPIVGPIDAVLVAGKRRVFAGLRDDPCFFDLDGWQATLDTHTLLFDPTHDSFAGTNASAIVLELELAAVVEDAEWIQLWATTHRR